MKKYQYIIPRLFVIVSLFAVSSCEDTMDVVPPLLEVTVEGEAWKVGDPVKFLIQGSADIISFYSDEEGHRYAYKNTGEEFNINGLQVSFSSQFSNTASGPCVRKVLVSTDFSGNYQNPYDVVFATWNDITDDFTLASNNTLTPSGTIDITRYREEDRPLYFAFMYKHFAFANEAGAPSWRPRAFEMTAITGDGNRLLANISDTYYSAGFNIVDFSAGTDMEGIGGVWADYIRLEGRKGPVTKGNEIWAISRALDPFVYRLPNETSIPVKAQSDTELKEYSYRFDKAGEYDVVFVGENTSAENSSQVVTKLHITVVD